MKKCPHCGEVKPLAEFHRNAASRDGLQSRCKPCHIATVSEAQRKNPEAKRETNRRYRERHPDRCKESDAKWRAKDPERTARLDAEKARRWRENNPGEAKKVIARYRAANPDKVAAWQKQWRDDNRDKYLARKRANARKHYSTERERIKREKWRTANPERARALDNEKSKRWAAKNPHKVNDLTSRRRSAVRAASPAWREQAKIDLVYLKARELGLQVDHIVPLNGKIVSGLHVWHNLQLLDGRLNTAKRNRRWPDMPTED